MLCGRSFFSVGVKVSPIAGCLSPRRASLWGGHMTEGMVCTPARGHTQESGALTLSIRSWASVPPSLKHCPWLILLLSPRRDACLWGIFSGLLVLPESKQGALCCAHPSRCRGDHGCEVVCVYVHVGRTASRDAQPCCPLVSASW